MRFIGKTACKQSVSDGNISNGIFTHLVLKLYKNKCIMFIQGDG